MSRNKEKATAIDKLKEIPGYPSEQRFKKGIVAVLECEQEIPCNPCEDLCPQNAITVGTPITRLPVLHEDLCIGCGLCVAGCPGQAIFMVDKTYSETEELVGFPYEYLNVPAPGDTVRAADRNGEYVGDGKVVRVIDNKKNNQTKIIYLAVQNGKGDEVRSIVKEK